MRFTATILSLTLGLGCIPAQDFFYLGNSLTDQLAYDWFEDNLLALGEDYSYGRYTAPGIRIKPLWEGGSAETSMNARPRDAITLQPFGGSMDEVVTYGSNFIQSARNHNANVQAYLYAQWPPNLGRDWEYDWNLPDGVSGWSTNTKAFWEEAAINLGAANPNAKTVRLIPAGHVMHLLHQYMRADLIDGFDGMYDLYKDQVHLDNLGSFIVACTFYACLYEKNPKDFPIGLYQGNHPTARGTTVITDALADLVRQLTWQVVATHPLTGISSSDPNDVLLVATPGLPHATIDDPYKAELMHAFGTGPYSWSIAAGTLPAGLNLGAADGIISGTPSSTGSSSFTVQVTDSLGAIAQRQLSLTIDPDTAPSITATALGNLQRGVWHDERITSSGGNGILSWTVTAGSLPTGMKLTSGGLLQGSPGKAVDYDVTITVTDGDSESPESDSRRFTGQIAAADPAITTFAGPAGTANVDDWPDWDASSWQNQMVDKLVDGTAMANTPHFAVSWNTKYLFVRVSVDDSNIVDGSYWPGDGDEIVIYIDGLNNRETIYNNDDRRISINPRGNVQVVGSRTYLNGQVRIRTGEGWDARFRIGWNNIGPGWMDGAADIVKGFDVGVIDRNVRGEAYDSFTVWRGSIDNDTDPSQFGVLITADSVQDPGPQPNTELGLQVQALSHEAIQLSWQEITEATWYLVQRKATGVTDSVSVLLLPKDSSGWRDEQLAPESSYDYRVDAGK